MIERLLGRLLRGRHAGETRLAWHRSAVAAPACIALGSSSFPPGGIIPVRFGGKGVGENIAPALSWSGLPQGTASLALIVEDPDAPMPSPFVHLIATGIDPALPGLDEGVLSGADLPRGVSLGRNTFGKRAYAGPRPLPGHGPHRYVFQLFASNRRLDFARPPNRAELMAALAGTVIGKGRLDGFVERK
jgi:Raf kinase inhibitor-like YbhB/YbcL family protein